MAGRQAALWNREQKIVRAPTKGLWSLYLDGSLTPMVPLRPLVEGWLESHEMALFKHPHRDCAYREIEACADRGKITKQEACRAMAHLAISGLPPRAGLYACGMLARRTSGVLPGCLQPAWWALVKELPRDQIWLPYALHMLPGSHGRINVIEADIFDNEWFSFRRHGR